MFASVGGFVDAHEAEEVVGTGRGEAAGAVVINLNQQMPSRVYTDWTEGTAIPVICYGSRAKEADGRSEVGGMKGRQRSGCTDMFTREGNIPHANRNEKPAAAAKRPPATSPRGRCVHGGWDREARVEGRGFRKPRKRRVEEGQGTVLNHFPPHLTLFRLCIDLRE